MDGCKGYSPEMMAAGTLTLGEVERLQQRAVTAARYREQATRLHRAAHIVESHWHDLPYEVREKIGAAFAADPLSKRFKQPLTLGDCLGILRLPFSIVKAYVMGNDFLHEYAVAEARLILAVLIRMHDDEEVAQVAWDRITRDDPAFVAAHERGLAAVARGAFVEVDWTKDRPTTTH